MGKEVVHLEMGLGSSQEPRALEKATPPARPTVQLHCP